MEQITPQDNGGEPSHEQKVSVSGKISLENSSLFDTNKAINDIATAIHNETSRQNQETNRIDSITNRQVNAQERANTISMWAVFFSGLAFAATLAVFILYYKLYLQTDKNFATINEPILQVWPGVPISNAFTKGSHPIVTIRIEDLAVRSIRIDSAMLGIRYDSANAKDIFTENDTDIAMNYDVSYVAPSLPFSEEKFTSVIKMNDTIMGNYACNKDIVFGVIYYTNYITNKPRYYIFSVTVSTTDFSPSANGWRVIKTHLSENTNDRPDYIENRRKWLFNRRFEKN